MEEKYLAEKNATSSVRAIVDVGLIDIEAKHLKPEDASLKIIGASSDMMVVDMGSNMKNFKVGDEIKFRMDYMGILRIMHSGYVEKRMETAAFAAKKAAKIQAVLN